MTMDLKPSDLLSSIQLREIKKKKDWKNVSYLFLNWLQIFLSMAIYHFFPSVVTLILGIIIVGSRQFALAVLMHEGAHSLLFDNKYCSSINLHLHVINIPLRIIFNN